MKKHRAVRLFRLTALLFALILASALLCSLASCGKDKETETPVGLIAVYEGPDITATDHVFEKSDFKVLVSYADGRDTFVDDFEFEQLNMSQGYYVFRFAYQGFEQEAYVQCHADFFPSDKGNEE